MPVLPVGTWGGQSGGRNRGQQPMNYATGPANDTGNGGGQSQNPAPTPYAPPQLNMGFGMPNSMYAGAHMRPGYGMPQGYMRGMNIAPQPLPMRFQQQDPRLGMANQLAGQMGNNLQNFAGRIGGMQGGQPYNMRPMPINPSALVQARRGVLPAGY